MTLKNVNGAEHDSRFSKVIQGGIYFLGLAYRRAGKVTRGKYQPRLFHGGVATAWKRFPAGLKARRLGLVTADLGVKCEVELWRVVHEAPVLTGVCASFSPCAMTGSRISKQKERQTSMIQTQRPNQPVAAPNREAVKQNALPIKSAAPAKPVRKDPGPLSESDIAAKAYAIWLAEGQPAGQAMKHWLEAERQLRNP